MAVTLRGRSLGDAEVLRLPPSPCGEPEKTYRDGELNTGTKLRLVNNSRVPISIVAFGSE